MRVLISLAAFCLVCLVGVKTEWVSVSLADPGAPTDRVAEDRAYEAVVLGQTRADATSGELIDAAAMRGDISSEQALLYGVYLACGDPRLPTEFRGQDAAPPAKNILWEADVEWAALAPDTQQALRAFFTAGAPACADDIARLRGDASVWWAPALQPDAPVLVATK